MLLSRPIFLEHIFFIFEAVILLLAFAAIIHSLEDILSILLRHLSCTN